MKLHNFQKVLPRARKVKGDPFVTQGKLPPTYKVKNVQSREVVQMLRSAGYVIEGEVILENNTTFGMFKGDEHIIVTDTGKYPFYLGDTTIRLGTMTRLSLTVASTFIKH